MKRYCASPLMLLSLLLLSTPTFGAPPTRDGYPWTGEASRLEVDCNADFGDPSTSPYILPYPVGMEYAVLQSYCSEDPGDSHYQSIAYDFGLAIGDTVIAARGGSVYQAVDVFPDHSGAYNQTNWTTIVHDDGTVAIYGHFTQNGLFVSAGDVVEKGQVLGLSGNSGHDISVTPHLHLETFADLDHIDVSMTLPFNFSNADGPLDANHGLIAGEWYQALPWDHVVAQETTWSRVKAMY